MVRQASCCCYSGIAVVGVFAVSVGKNSVLHIAAIELFKIWLESISYRIRQKMLKPVCVIMISILQKYDGLSVDKKEECNLLRLVIVLANGSWGNQSKISPLFLVSALRASYI